MFGTEGDLVGRTVLELVRKQTVAAALEKALHGEASSVRISYDAGESERQIEVRTFPVSSPEIAAVALFIDVTTIERLQRIRKEFLDDFSHEVRTPLAGLRSAAETLEHGGLTREYEQQLRHIMHRQIARIERLVKDLSELNAIESGQLVLQRRRVNLRHLIEELCDDFRGRVESVRFDVQGDDTMAFVDPPRAQQIFTNLLDNACKHGGGKGEISVAVTHENGEAVVRVSDEGPGIPPAELERIFNRFYRVDRSRSQAGTGLGLAIAKHLVVAHGGAIRAFNRPTGGATFEVRLPVELT
jgi:two-component system phosphate regulon sensor histidine kinase PhoR